jgi:hypothetical protein
LRLIVVVLAVAQIALIGLIGYDANRDRDADAAETRLAACRAEQSSAYSETNWTTLALLLESVVKDEDGKVAELVTRMRQIQPLDERIEEHCDV